MKKIELIKLIPIMLAASAIGIVFYATNANATKPKPPPKPEQSQQQDQSQGQEIQQNITTTGGPANAIAKSGDATNEGNSLSVESNYEASPADVVLVPHNNTANCQRVYGLGGGNNSGNVVLGVPFRDRTCDLEAAADDAFAQGNLTLGWVFKCKQKNIRKAFGGEQECLEAVARPDIVRQLKDRIEVLTDQKATLLEERKHDQARCKEETKRAHETCVGK